MPELPEVECVRRQIDSALLGWRIAAVSVHRADVITAPASLSTTTLAQRLLCSRTILRTARHGKQLAMIADDDRALRVQLGMTGILTIVDAIAEPRDRHVHIVWTVERASARRFVLFRDPRRFGGVEPFASISDLYSAWSSLGPDAESISSAALRSALAQSARSIKSALLDQRRLAGVGNIYADEALFRAGIDPRRTCAQLTASEVARIASSIRQILRSAIARGGSSIRDYRGLGGEPGSFQHRHQVYGRAGLPCVRCKKPLCHDVIGQRSSTFCRTCQS